MRLRRPGFVTGILCGVLVVFSSRMLINRTPFADYLVAPLLMPDTPGRADALVVLGAGVVGECGANQFAVRRVLLGARLWREGRAPVMIITGGPTKGSCPVATAMADLAREIGVPDGCIRLETASRSTHENAEKTAPLLRAMGARRVLLVTDRLHMRRASAVFTAAGFDVERASVPIYEGHPDNVSMLTAGMREFAALAYYRMHGWLTPTARRATTDKPAESAPANGSDMAQRTNPTGQPAPLVILGASYAGGWTPGTLAGMTVTNKGVTGQQSFELLERFERDVVSARPRVVIIWGFINDFFRATPDQAAATEGRVRESYLRMIALARQNGIEPVLATEVTLRPGDSFSERIASWVGWALGKESYQDRINGSVLAMNEWLTGAARQEGLLLLDFQRALSEDGRIRRREFTQADGSHITAAGYSRLTEYAAPLLQQRFGSRTAAPTR